MLATTIPEPINAFLVICMFFGLLIAAAGGMALTVWIVERLCNFTYKRGQHSKAFVEFLYWRHAQRKKKKDAHGITDGPHGQAVQKDAGRG